MLRYDFRAWTAIIITAFALSACSSDGSLAFDGGAGVGGSGAGASGASTLGAFSEDGSFASAGNVGDLLSQTGLGVGEGTDGETVQAVRDVVDPLSRVSVGNETLTGADGQSALGASALSPTQSQGQVATVGVLSNGQVATLNVNGQGQDGTNLVGVQADNDQVLGGSNNALGVNALSDTQQQGSVGTVTALSNGQIANAQVNNAQGGAPAGGLLGGAQGGGVVGTVTNTLNSLTGGQ